MFLLIRRCYNLNIGGKYRTVFLTCNYREKALLIKGEYSYYAKKHLY